ncbi:hypothetical protein GS504_01830 [Rhodococcus hoagii]|nr:hypothetical protein [Prescottella equi]NKS72237.1 hypothetical protein [Prescottella equi]
MTHRSRRLIALAVALIVAGFVLTIVNGRGVAAEKDAPAAMTDDGQPIAGIYVPQPAAVIAGHNIATAAVVHDAAREFVTAYLTFDTKAPLDAYLSRLPRVAESSKADLRGAATRTWQSVGAGRQAKVLQPETMSFTDDRSSVDTYTVSTKVQVTVTSPGSAPSTSTRALTVTIHREPLGWMVTQVQSVAR